MFYDFCFTKYAPLLFIFLQITKQHENIVQTSPLIFSSLTKNNVTFASSQRKHFLFWKNLKTQQTKL